MHSSVLGSSRRRCPTIASEPGSCQRTPSVSASKRMLLLLWNYVQTLNVQLTIEQAQPSWTTSGLSDGEATEWEKVRRTAFASDSLLRFFKAQGTQCP
jgi:hypothetical protein